MVGTAFPHTVDVELVLVIAMRKVEQRGVFIVASGAFAIRTTTTTSAAAAAVQGNGGAPAVPRP